MRQEKGQESGKWTEEEEQRFVQGFLQLMDRYSIKDPLQFSHWSELSTLVQTRNPEQCRHKFIVDFSRKSTEMTGEYKVRWSKEDDQILLSRLLTLCAKAQDESEIKWESLVTPDWMPWTHRILRDRWLKLYENIPESEQTKPFFEQVQYCFSHLEAVSKSAKRKRDILIVDEEDEDVWTYQDSQELLSRLSTLCSDAEDETEVDWTNLVWGAWTADVLQQQWYRMKNHIPDFDSMAFMGNSLLLFLYPKSLTRPLKK
jgi:hypothetical protein